MDIDLFRDGEQFSTFDSNCFLDNYHDDSTSIDNINSFSNNELFEWNLDTEREINGDIALIPMSSGINQMSPAREDIQRIMNEWHQLISMDPTCEDFKITEPEISHEPINIADDFIQPDGSISPILDLPNPENFDLTSYITEGSEDDIPPLAPSSSGIAVGQIKIQEEELEKNVVNNVKSTTTVNKQQHKAAGMKKIDLQAQRYIIEDDDDEVDVETVSESGENSPVLEAGDITTLLEQFEATELPNQTITNISNNINNNDIDVCIKPESYNILRDDLECSDSSDDEDEEDNKKIVKLSLQQQQQKDVKMVTNIEKSKKAIKCNTTSCKKRKAETQGEIKVKKENVDVINNIDNVKECKTEKDEEWKPQKRDKIEKTPTLPQKTSNNHHMCQKTSSIQNASTTHPKTTTNHQSKIDTVSNNNKASRQIIDTLPQELITRIKESTKRKTISVIPPIPNKKTRSERHTNKMHKNSQQQQQTTEPKVSNNSNLITHQDISTKKTDVSRLNIIIATNNVFLDHSYCAQTPPSTCGGSQMSLLPSTKVIDNVLIIKKKETHENNENFNNKDKESLSSTSSTITTVKVKEENEEPASVIGTQPMVKNADGKLMVSLLKVNTIRTTTTATSTNTSSNNVTQKKKLNLEEYKKRREGVWKSQNNSQNCSPNSNSTSNSPLPEDENLRRIKHQEKLMKMALEVLNTAPKSEKMIPQKSPSPAIIVPDVIDTAAFAAANPPPVLVPHNMERKTLVSIGVNTTFKVLKNLDPLTPVEQLEEIKPLLKKASDKINSHSLITSLIENIPKVIESCSPIPEATQLPSSSSTTTSGDDGANNNTEHGEDKTIVFLPKDRAEVQTRSIECQTNISLIRQFKASRYRRRRDSSSNSSCCSTSSSLSSSSSSRSCCSKYSRRRKCSSSSSSSNVSRAGGIAVGDDNSRRSYNNRSSRSSGSSCSSSLYSSRSSSRSRSRSRSPKHHSRRERELIREVEERRVIYVGDISPGTTKDDLRKKFHHFGPITDISLHSRDRGDYYGFVTFANKLDAYEAKEHGNDDPYYPKYELSFGGRRLFCKTSYSDLDNMRDDQCYYTTMPRIVDNSFDSLLREAQEKLRKRKA